MIRFFRKMLFAVLFCFMMLALSQAALAAETFRTTEGINFRAEPSTAARIIRTIGPGVSVEVLEHDPAGWSMAKLDGTTGFIRSDFLMRPIGNAPVVFRTTGGVNLRVNPSTEATVVRTVSAGAQVEVHGHDPAGWSAVTVGGSAGYIRSDLLVLPIQGSQQGVNGAAPVQALTQAPTTLTTTDGVNLRESPTTYSRVIKTVPAGTSVQVLEHDPVGWSRVTFNGTGGFIRSDFLTEGSAGRNVELLNWSAARGLIRNGVPMRVVDVRTGITFNLVSFSIGGHADVEPQTRADTDAILRSRNGVWAWSPRPVWVSIGDRTIAASLNGMPHGGSTITSNGMNGHLCLHFAGTVTSSKTYQRALNNAVQEAWNAAR